MGFKTKQAISRSLLETLRTILKLFPGFHEKSKTLTNLQTKFCLMDLNLTLTTQDSRILSTEKGERSLRTLHSSINMDSQSQLSSTQKKKSLHGRQFTVI